MLLVPDPKKNPVDGLIHGAQKATLNHTTTLDLWDPVGRSGNKPNDLVLLGARDFDHQQVFQECAHGPFQSGTLCKVVPIPTKQEMSCFFFFEPTVCPKIVCKYA